MGWRRFESAPSSGVLCEAWKLTACSGGALGEEKAAWFKCLSVKQEESEFAVGTRPPQSDSEGASPSARPPEAAPEERTSAGCRFTAPLGAAEPIRDTFLEEGESEDEEAV